MVTVILSVIYVAFGRLVLMFLCDPMRRKAEDSVI